MFNIRNPKHVIKAFRNEQHQFINIHEIAESGEGQPDFGFHFETIEYKKVNNLWKKLFDLLCRDRNKNINLWNNCERMDQIRKLYNQIIVFKAKFLPKYVRRNP